MSARLGRLLDGLFGAKCAGCGAAGSSACDACGQQLARLPMPAAALYPDRAPARALVRRAKFGEARAALDVLLAARARELDQLVVGYDAVTWVPADPLRRRLRGWHLPELFARRLAERGRLPALRLLVRTRRTAPQRGRSRAQRQANVAAAFVAAPSPHALRILLVDDVRTTGATLGAAAGALRQRGHHVDSLALVAVDGVR